MAFTLVMLLVSGAGAGGLALAYLRFFKPLPSGVELNRLAWEASYLEHGLPVPPSGPREGYWSSAMAPWVEDPELGWREAETHIPGPVEADANGEQTLVSPGARQHLLVIGGSVAWGLYASAMETTWFAKARPNPGRARPAAAPRHPGGRGLGEPPRDRRVNDYLDDVHAARDLCRAHGAAIAVALQPFPLQKRMRSRLEERTIELTVDELTPARLLRSGYARRRGGLASAAPRQEQ